jgi:tetratricopeptide (TPR) repeat protein
MENRIFRERQVSAAERESLQRGLAFYERFAEQNSGHAELRGVMAKANLRAGFLRLDLKDWKEAQAHLKKAMPVLERLADESAGTASNRWDLARCCFGLYQVLMKDGHLREAELNCRRAIGLLRELAAEFPGETTYRVELGHCLWQLGGRDFDGTVPAADRRKEDETITREALAVFEGLVAEHPTNKHFRQETAFSHRRLCAILVDLGRLEEAADSERRAIVLYRELVAESPANTFYQQELALSCLELGRPLVADQKFPEAEAAYVQAIAGFTKLVGEFNMELHGWGLADACQHLSQLRKRAGQLDEAAEHLRVALAVWEKLSTEFDNPEYRNCWVTTQSELTYVLFERAREVDQEATGSPAERQTAARTYREQAAALLLSAATGSAHFVARSNLADYPVSGALLAESLVQVAQKPGGNRPEVSRVLHWFGVEYLKRQKHAEAEPLFSACLSIREQEEPHAWMTFATRVRLAEALSGQQKYAEAEPFLLQGYDGLILHEAQVTAEEKHTLSDAVNLLVELYDASGETAKADRWRRVQVAQKAAFLADSGSLHARTGKWAQAINEYNQVLEIEPHHFAARKGRAELFLNIGLLPEAAVENTQLFPLQEPADSIVFLHHALLCRWQEDEAGYRRTCELMLARFADSTDSEDWARIAIVLGYSPESAIEPSRTVSFAARAAGNGKNVWRTAYLGLAYFRAGQFDRAAAALEDSLKIDPNWFPAIVFAIQGMVQHRLGNVMQASAALGNASSARDVYLEAMLAQEIGFWPAPWRDVVHAELLYREAYGLIRGSTPPEDGRLLILRGRALDAILRFEAAIAAFDKAIESRPEAGEAWSGRALVLFHQQQWKRAVADFNRAIELDPKVQRNWWHRGHCHIDLAQWDKAAADFGHIIDQWPDGAEGWGWFWHSVALTNLNQPDKAIADLRKAMARGLNAELIKHDSRLDALRTHEGFQELLRDFERQEKVK